MEWKPSTRWISQCIFNRFIGFILRLNLIFPYLLWSLHFLILFGKFFRRFYFRFHLALGPFYVLSFLFFIMTGGSIKFKIIAISPWIIPILWYIPWCFLARFIRFIVINTILTIYFSLKRIIVLYDKTSFISISWHCSSPPSINLYPLFSWLVPYYSLFWYLAEHYIQINGNRFLIDQIYNCFWDSVSFLNMFLIYTKGHAILISHPVLNNAPDRILHRFRTYPAQHANHNDELGM